MVHPQNNILKTTVLAGIVPEMVPAMCRTVTPWHKALADLAGLRQEKSSTAASV